METIHKKEIERYKQALAKLPHPIKGVDNYAIISGIKKLSRTEGCSLEEARMARKFYKLFQLFVSFRELNNQKIKLYISRDKELSEYFSKEDPELKADASIKEFYDFGRALGYPSCCAEDHINSYGKGSEELIRKFNQTKKSAYCNWLLYHHHLSLSFHQPCSLSCKKTIEYNKGIFQFIKEINPLFASYIAYWSNKPMYIWINKTNDEVMDINDNRFQLTLDGNYISKDAISLKRCLLYSRSHPELNTNHPRKEFISHINNNGILKIDKNSMRILSQEKEVVEERDKHSGIYVQFNDDIERESGLCNPYSGNSSISSEPYFIRKTYPEEGTIDKVSDVAKSGNQASHPINISSGNNHNKWHSSNHSQYHPFFIPYPEKRKTKKTVIFMGYACNNNCIFCCNQDKRGKIRTKSVKEIKQDLINSRQQGSDYIELIGGEPTIRKDIFDIVSFAKELGYETIMFATNGRMFSNREFAKKIIETGVNHIVFSIHGHNAELHDKLTKVKGSFNQLIQGLKNVQDLGLENIGSNTAIVRQNYEHLLDIGKLIYDFGIRNSEFIFVDPSRGAPLTNFFSIVPTYEEVSPYVNQLLGFGKEKRVPHWDIRYYPLCFVDEKYHGMISEISEKNTFETKHIAPDFYSPNVAEGRKTVGRTKIEKCKECKYAEICEGYWKEYVKQRKLK